MGESWRPPRNVLLVARAGDARDVTGHTIGVATDEEVGGHRRVQGSCSDLIADPVRRESWTHLVQVRPDPGAGAGSPQRVACPAGMHEERTSALSRLLAVVGRSGRRRSGRRRPRPRLERVVVDGGLVQGAIRRAPRYNDNERDQEAEAPDGLPHSAERRATAVGRWR